MGVVEVDGSEVSDGWSDEYEETTDVTLQAIAADGFEFVQWYGDHTGTENPTTVAMDEHKTITAVFAEEEEVETYDLTFVVFDGANDFPMGTQVMPPLLEGALVEVVGVGTQETDSNGEAVFPDLAPDDYDYTVSKAGYATETGDVQIVDADLAVYVTLVPEEEVVLIDNVAGTVSEYANYYYHTVTGDNVSGEELEVTLFIDGDPHPGAPAIVAAGESFSITWAFDGVEHASGTVVAEDPHTNTQTVPVNFE